jgi:tellurite resistance protein TerC
MRLFQPDFAGWLALKRFIGCAGCNKTIRKVVVLAETMLWQWIAFAVVVAVLLSLDLLVFHRHDHAPTLRESAGWSAFWISIALGFNGLVWWWDGGESAVAFLGGYMMEKALSIDNIFVFAVIFRFFHVPMRFQYRVLFWGILGAIFLRLIFIVAGVQLIHYFEWILPLFGVLLVYTAFRLAVHADSEVRPDQNPVLRLARRFFRVTQAGSEQHGHAFFIRENGRVWITPLFLVLLVIESSDVVFAVDSIPAVFGITTNPFIVFTSNIFAILGLRALFFLLAGVIEMFRYLHYGLSAVLAFIGLNMIADYWLSQPDEHLVPTWGKLVVIAALVGISILASVWQKKPQEPDAKKG